MKIYAIFVQVRASAEGFIRPPPTAAASCLVIHFHAVHTEIIRQASGTLPQSLGNLAGIAMRFKHGLMVQPFGPL